MPVEKGPPGQPVDAYGGQTIDPTNNVLQLVEAAVTRLNDLAKAEALRVDEKASLRETFLQKLVAVEVEHQKELNLAEAKRIDAIRAVDVNAVAVASERAAAQATVLANQVSQSAETLRALVAQTAATIAQQLSQLTSQLTDRLSLLEKSQYENKGLSGSSPLLDRLNMMERSLSQGEGKGAAKQSAITNSVAIIAVFISLILLGLRLSGH